MGIYYTLLMMVEVHVDVECFDIYYAELASFSFSLIGLVKSITRGGQMEMTSRKQMFLIYDWNFEIRYVKLPYLIGKIKCRSLYFSIQSKHDKFMVL